MSLDKVNSTAAIAVSTGVLTIKTRIYCNDAVAAAFAAVTSGQAYPTVTHGTGYIDVSLAITPDTPVGVYAEAMHYLQDYSTAGYGTIL